MIKSVAENSPYVKYSLEKLQNEILEPGDLRISVFNEPLYHNWINYYHRLPYIFKDGHIEWAVQFDRVSLEDIERTLFFKSNSIEHAVFIESVDRGFLLV